MSQSLTNQELARTHLLVLSDSSAVPGPLVKSTPIGALSLLTPGVSNLLDGDLGALEFSFQYLHLTSETAWRV